MNALDELKLARVIDACGGVDGRVKLQKIVYLLKAMGYELPFNDFRIRQLGPFSRAVACATDALSVAGFVSEKEEDLGENDIGEPLRQYSYQVLDSVKALVKKRFDVPAPAGKPPIDASAPELRKHDRAVLEVAATKLYLQREDKLKGEKLETELKRLKGHLCKRFDAADKLLKDMHRKGWL